MRKGMYKSYWIYRKVMGDFKKKGMYKSCELVRKLWYLTCKTEAPACKYCIPTSALSIPPVARTGKPGRARAMADTARSAIGRIALPETPPYVVRCCCPIDGHADASPRNPIKPETVFVAVTPSALPVATEHETRSSHVIHLV